MPQQSGLLNQQLYHLLFQARGGREEKHLLRLFYDLFQFLGFISIWLCARFDLWSVFFLVLEMHFLSHYSLKIWAFKKVHEEEPGETVLCLLLTRKFNYLFNLYSSWEVLVGKRNSKQTPNQSASMKASSKLQDFYTRQHEQGDILDQQV